MKGDSNFYDNILEVENLSKKFSLDSGFFARKDRFVHALNDVSFYIRRGETYGIVGESGSGKSTLAKVLAGMYKGDGGNICFNSKNDGTIRYVFQDPARSLNPRLTVYSILTDGLRFAKSNKKVDSKEELLCKAQKIIKEVGLDKSDLDKRPSQFSGGQRQRISIARGLLGNPELLLCDEVVSALDVSIQGQILNLLKDIKKTRSLSYLFIAHDLRVSCYFCDRIGVMYRGFLLEEADAADFYKTAAHPYSKLLFEGALGTANENAGEIKSSLTDLKGCPFAHRCTKAKKYCFEECPPWKELSSLDKQKIHRLRCFEV
ncbi:ABC transporter ATP-binding protein [Treponema pectinovorum]|uniref:ABC transporter ATP-binding protein n=1 Tax=Treponema pectinovorum TaxID=164 RepID=UPI0011F2444A|nr:ABC transporter ATP-binding protein [Treponema pectinovorum]